MLHEPGGSLSDISALGKQSSSEESCSGLSMDQKNIIKGEWKNIFFILIFLCLFNIVIQMEQR